MAAARKHAHLRPLLADRPRLPRSPGWSLHTALTVRKKPAEHSRCHLQFLLAGMRGNRCVRVNTPAVPRGPAFPVAPVSPVARQGPVKQVKSGHAVQGPVGQEHKPCEVTTCMAVCWAVCSPSGQNCGCVQDRQTSTEPQRLLQRHMQIKLKQGRKMIWYLGACGASRPWCSLSASRACIQPCVSYPRVSESALSFQVRSTSTYAQTNHSVNKHSRSN